MEMIIASTEVVYSSRRAGKAADPTAAVVWGYQPGSSQDGTSTRNSLGGSTVEPPGLEPKEAVTS